MWERFQENGAEGFQDHELLEMLLYFVIRRGNTNETAHRLLKEFSSLRGVMNASPGALCAVEGVGEKTAEYLNFVNSFYTRCEVADVQKQSLKMFDDRVRYFVARLSSCKEENLCIACLDTSLRVIRCSELIKGTFNHVMIEPFTVVSYILRSPCHAVIMAHNHPEGKAMPSFEDVETTYYLASMLKFFSVELIDHVIVADNRGCSMLKTGIFHPDKIKSNFFHP
ncbi:MAG: hypothetical protein II916_04440 [Oscillospiraceae bacterium]|nr:hypothetical protein [Oscillospiraceae bacterium]